MSSIRPLRSRAPIIAAMLGIALAAAVPTGLSLAVEGEGIVFRIGVTQGARPVELNPFRTTSGMGYSLIADRYDLLIGFGENLEPAPGLAESWETSEDGLVWTYHIRQGATWQDGQPVTAEDAAFTLNYIIDSHDPTYIGPGAPNGNDLPRGNQTEPNGVADNPLSLFDNYIDLDAGIENSRVTTVEATDPNTLVITTSEPIITLSQIFIPILPKHIWELKTFEAASQRIELAEAIGSGPFQIIEFEPSQFMRLRAYDGYWGGTPHIDELIYQYFDNDEAQVNALKAGDVDLLDNFPPTLIGALEDDPNITINRAQSTDFAELGFNSWAPDAERFEAEGCADCQKGPTTGSLGDPWITRPDVRAALAGLLDKQHLVEFALSGYGQPGVSLISPLTSFYHYTPPPEDLVTFPAYTDEAGRVAARATAEQRFRDAMAAIGFTDTDGNGILNAPDDPAFDPEGAGQDWSLRLFVREDDEEDKLAGQLIQGWFTAAGVPTEYREVSEDPELYRVTYPSSSNAEMDLYLWGWGPDPDPDFILSVLSCNQINGWQDANYCDADYDQLYRDSRTAIDLNERAEIVKDLQDKLYHESPYAVLWYVDTVEAYRSDRWQGFNSMPRSGGAIWSTYGMGPWGSRTTLGPIGGESGPTPAPAAPTPSGQPTASASGEPPPSGSQGPTQSAPAPTNPPSTGRPGGSAVAPSQPGTSAGQATPLPSAATPGTGAGGSADMTLIAVGGIAAAVGAAAVFLVLRRRRLDEDDEDE